MKAALISVTLLVCHASPGPQTNPQVFHSGVQTVFVDASVLRGRTSVANLTDADFTLTDNGVPQRIESLTGTGIPLDVSLVFDATWYSLAGSEELQRNARQVAGLLRPDDRLAVFTYAFDVTETRLMSPVGPNPSSLRLTSPTTPNVDQRFRIGQALLTAMTAPVPPDRRHVVVLFAAGRGEPEVPSLDFLADAAQRADALLYVVLTPPRQTYDTHRPLVYPSEVVIRSAVTKAAEATGGKAYLTGDIVGAFRDILKQFRASYVLRYTLQGVPSAGWHDIVVKVPSCPPCTVRARRGYMGR